MHSTVIGIDILQYGDLVLSEHGAKFVTKKSKNDNIVLSEQSLKTVAKKSEDVNSVLSKQCFNKFSKGKKKSDL